MTISRAAIASLISQTAQLAPDYLDSRAEGGATVEREQACYLPVGSGDPVIGQIEGTGEGKGVWVASGHSCWGIVSRSSCAPYSGGCGSPLSFFRLLCCRRSYRRRHTVQRCGSLLPSPSAAWLRR